MTCDSSTSPPIRVSVTTLVALYARDLGFGLRDSDLGSDIQTGLEVHERIEARFGRSPSLETEQPVTHCIDHRRRKVMISGRIDMLKTESAGHATVIEIKSCESPAAAHRAAKQDPAHPHQFQAALYGWMIGASRDISCRSEVLYASLGSNVLRRLEVNWSADQLEAALRKALDAKMQALQLAEAKRQRRQKLLRQLAFPYPRHRPSQSVFMSFVSDSLSRRQPSLIEAPTGSGKTMSALYPSLRQTLQRGQTLFFSTSKNSQKRGCIRAIQAFKGPHPSKPSAVALESRETLCLQRDNPICGPATCRFANGYGLKFRQSRIPRKTLERNLAFDAPLLRALGQHYEICPFELALDLSEIADVVVCDYNHITSPTAHLKRFFAADKDPQAVQCIFDEAHSLPERACAQLSPELVAEPPHRTDRRTRRFFSQIAIAIEDFVHGYELGSDYSTLGEEPFPLRQRLDDLARASCVAMQKYTRAKEQLPFNDPATLLHQDVLNFCTLVGESPLGRFEAYSLLAKRSPSVHLRLLCKDPKSHLKSFFESFKSSVIMSATLSPLEHFAERLGLANQSETRSLRLASDFPSDHRKLVIVPQLTSLFRHRSVQIPKMAHTISRILDLQPVNTIVFSPSFELSRQIVDLCQVPSDFEILVQKPQSTREDVEAILDALANADRPHVLFAVMRGAFSEGVDLPGRAVESVILTGPPLSPPSIEQSLKLAYEGAQSQQAFDKIVVVPAMVQVNQSIGRLIRSPTDRGTCFLLDYRFLEAAYFSRLAPEWRQNLPGQHVPFELARELKMFWSGVTDVSSDFSQSANSVKNIGLRSRTQTS